MLSAWWWFIWWIALSTFWTSWPCHWADLKWIIPLVFFCKIFRHSVSWGLNRWKRLLFVLQQFSFAIIVCRICLYKDTTERSLAWEPLRRCAKHLFRQSKLHCMAVKKSTFFFILLQQIYNTKTRYIIVALMLLVLSYYLLLDYSSTESTCCTQGWPWCQTGSRQ